MHQITRLLVVGGNGFIGRHVVAHAVGLGWEVTSLTLRPSGGAHPVGVRTAVGDVADLPALRSALGNGAFEYVVNCGGYVDHTLFSKGGRALLGAHFEGVLNLVEILDREVLRSFVNFGSSDEYGNSPAPQVETQREAPISPYSLSKMAATHFLQMLWCTEGFPSTTLRPFLVYGPGQGVQRFLPQIIRGCLDGRSFPTSEGRQLRDFCYIQDMIDAVFVSFDCPAARGEVVNVASGQPVSIRQMIETVRRLTGQGEPRFGEIAYRPGENMALYANIAKAGSLLKWAPKVSLERGLESTIQWIRDHS